MIVGGWTFDPFELLLLVAGGFLYWKRARTLASRGRPVALLRRASFYAGWAVVFFSITSPLDSIGEEDLFLVHMLQHIFLGDLAPLLIVLGLTGPILRPFLALPVIERLRFLAHPLVALPAWAISLYFWHLPALYEAALRYDAVHALEHISFFTFGALMWAALVEPLPGPAWFGTGWKILYIAAVRVLEAILANVFVWSGSAIYAGYPDGERLWGVSPVADINIGGVIMLAEGSLVTLGAFAWLFLRWADESELRQELIERGLDPDSVARAVRYGRGALLDEEHGQAGEAGNPPRSEGVELEPSHR